ncbi:hypothetical protein F2Q68_00009781 [Brassica cretica]|uniref:Uncharacterized protein n=1 Tax=Brassica cretica TaxID=69181 RepID=A0A8S9L257_BRACR|nr:hypothetical protein F2Q68_00009781 [Brassica cretica]
MEDMLKSYEHMHDSFTLPIMRYLDTLFTHMTNVQKDIGKLNDQHDFQEEGSTLIDSGLDSQAEWLQREVKAIQRQLAPQHQISASIDGAHSKSIASATPATIDRHLVASIDTTSIPDDAQLIPNHMESMQEQLNELSEYAYSKISWCMPSSTRSNKKKHMIFSEDPAHLERTIRKGQRSTSLDAAALTSTDSRTNPSTDTQPSSATDIPRPTSIDLTPFTLIDPRSRNMVATVILRHDENGDLYDLDGHLRNATGQKLDAQGNKNILTHPPISTSKSIDRMSQPSIDKERPTSIDPSPPIDRRTPLTHRVRLPSIDSIRITALRPPPKPLENPPEPTTNPSDTTPEPMQVDEATEGRVLRKRKEKTPKNLKREANEKEMDGFTKRVLRIPVEKQFDEVYFTHQLNDLGYIAACHCGAEYKIEYSELIDTHTARSIDSNESPMTDERYPTSLDGMQPVDHSTLPDQFYPDFAFQQPNKNGRDDYSIGTWADSGFHESFAVETVILSSNEDPTKEYDEDYWKERATGLLCRMKDIQPIPSTIRLHHQSTGTTQHRSILTLIQQNDDLHRSIPHLVYRSILKPPPQKRKNGIVLFKIGLPTPI